MGDKIIFYGQLSMQDIIKQYQNYFALLVPSIWQEPFGMIVVEAMSQGLPVIATKVGGIPEIITHGETGLLVAPDNPDELAHNVKKIIENPILYNKIRINGIELIRKNYLQEKIIDQLETYLQSLLVKQK